MEGLEEEEVDQGGGKGEGMERHRRKKIKKKKRKKRRPLMMSIGLRWLFHPMVRSRGPANSMGKTHP